MNITRTIQLFKLDSTGKRSLVAARPLDNPSLALIRDTVDVMAGERGYKPGDGFAVVLNEDGTIIDKLNIN